MKNSKKLLTLAAAMFAFSAIMTPQIVLAAQTLPCTEISNQAVLDYEVDGVLQPDVNSDDDGNDANGINSTKFNVGVKIIVDVTNQDGGNVSITPSNNTLGGNELEFLVTNSGNAIHDYLLATINEASDDGSIASPHAGVDEFSPGLPLAEPVTLYLENGAAAGLQLTGETNADIDLSAFANTIDDLNPATDYTAQGGGIGSRRVYVYYEPNELVAEDTKVGVYYLKATTLWAGGTALPGTLTDDGNDSLSVTNAMVGVGSCGAGTTVDVVLGDAIDDDSTSIAGTGLASAARNGESIDDSAFIVATAKLVVTKTKDIYSDPINGVAVNPAKAIPGAVVTYTITIENIGSIDATNVTFTDDLAAEIANLDFGNQDTDAGYGSSDGSFNDGVEDCTGGASQRSIVVTDGVAAATVACKTDASDAEVGADADFSGNVVTVTGLTVEDGETATVNFQVTLK